MYRDSRDGLNARDIQRKRIAQMLLCDICFEFFVFHQQYVNQDTGWDIPASPEPSVKDGVPVWKPNVNNGKDSYTVKLLAFFVYQSHICDMAAQ
jgi:hypothetical protein